LRRYLDKCYRRSKERGAALITVLVALMIISIVLLEFQYQSMVERKLAYNDLNQLQAYYLAKSGIHIGLLRIVLFGRARRDPNLSKSFGGADVGPILDMIWNLPLPSFPPDAAKLGDLLKEDRDAAQKILKETKITDGKFSHVITSESSKINLNYLMVPSNLAGQRITFDPPATSLFQNVGLMLINLMQNFLQASDDPFNEYGNLKPDEIVYNLMDWINPGANSFAGGAKDTFYQTQNPPYTAKRARFYSIEELKMVKGIDEHLYNKLKPFVTVYSYEGKVNLNTAGPDLYRALYRDFTEDDVKKIIEERDKRGGWTSESSFVEYLKTTLNRSGFTTVYPDPAQYPFTIATQSFMIESVGRITRSKSNIQKMIRVGVALTSGKGGVTVPGVVDPNQCTANPNWWWDSRFPPPVCKVKPTNNDECLFQAGTWQSTANGFCCVINLLPTPICPANAATAGSPGGPPPAPGAGGATPQAVTPNAVKILFWSES
jgi:type II secretory pathway component PulK